MSEVLTKQLDTMPREELRAEIRRLEGEILDMGTINARLYDGIREALSLLIPMSLPDEYFNQAAIKVLQRAIRKHRPRRSTQSQNKTPARPGR